MTIREFVETAVRGGWKFIDYKGFGLENYRCEIKVEESYFKSRTCVADGGCYEWNVYPFEVIFMNPMAWIAVGKANGWSESKFYSFDGIHATGETLSEAQWHFRRFCNELWKIKTIEEALNSIFI